MKIFIIEVKECFPIALRILTNVHRNVQSITLCTIQLEQNVRHTQLRSVSDRVRLNVAFSACIKQKKIKMLATQRLSTSFIVTYNCY